LMGGGTPRRGVARGWLRVGARVRRPLGPECARARLCVWAAVCVCLACILPLCV